jgi:hypothetical protein
MVSRSPAPCGAQYFSFSQSPKRFCGYFTRVCHRCFEPDSTHAPYFIALIIVIGVVSFIWGILHGNALVVRWAAANGFRVVSSQYKHFLRGPFGWMSSRGRVIYRITVEDRKGRMRSARVRCGSWWIGMLGNGIEVCWDDEPGYVYS